MRHGLRWTEEETDYVMRLHRQGKTYYEISKIIGRTEPAVQRQIIKGRFRTPMIAPAAPRYSRNHYLNQTMDTLYKLIDKYQNKGVFTMGAHSTHINNEWLIAQYNDGTSVDALARHYSMSTYGMWLYLAENGAYGKAERIAAILKTPVKMLRKYKNNKTDLVDALMALRGRA